MTTDRTGQTSWRPDPSHRPLPVLWICGAPGAGKSALAWELFEKHADEQVASVDIDQLKMLAPGSGDSFDLAMSNLDTLVAIHRDLGTQALIVSGVLDPEQMSTVESTVSGRTEVTWCLVDAEDAELRRRIRDRGWPEHLVEMVVSEARAWRAVPHIARIDTTSTTPASAAKDLEVPMVPRPAADPGARRRRDVMGGGDLVAFYGPRAVGKSTISWALFMECIERGEPTGYLDADQLGFVQADAMIRERLIDRAVGSIARTFREAGAARTIVNGNLSSELIAAWGEDQTVLVHLDASHEVLAQRITSRGEGDGARLAGDDLKGASEETRAAVLERADHQREEYAGASPFAHRIDVTAIAADAAARELIGLLPSCRPDHGEPPAEGIEDGACCVIITGSPASGKSTLTRRLAEELPRSAWLNGDRIHGVVVGGRVWALGEPQEEADRQTYLGNQNLIALAKNCAEAGFTPVIDWIIPDGAQLAQFVEGLAPLPLWLIVLDPGDAACRVRNLQREDSFAFDGYDELVGGMREAFGDSAWWIDSSDDSAEETFRRIMDRARPDRGSGPDGGSRPDRGSAPGLRTSA